jgi:hypothetical protein
MHPLPAGGGSLPDLNRTFGSARAQRERLPQRQDEPKYLTLDGRQAVAKRWSTARTRCGVHGIFRRSICLVLPAVSRSQRVNTLDVAH